MDKLNCSDKKVKMQLRRHLSPQLYPQSRPDTTNSFHGPRVELVFNKKSAPLRAYRSMDSVVGCALIHCNEDTLLHDIVIVFEGNASTLIRNTSVLLPVRSFTRTTHRFLTMRQPPAPEDSFEDRMARANRSYRVTFAFVIPRALLPSACNHPVGQSPICETHLLLPPSLGVVDCRRAAKTLGPGHEPCMPTIAYRVRATVYSTRPCGQPPVQSSEAIQCIQVLPDGGEDRPPSIDHHHFSYRMQCGIFARHGFWTADRWSGRLSAIAWQPPSLKLPTSDLVSDTPITTTVTVELQFDPLSRPQSMPQLAGVSSTLKIITSSSSTPCQNVPTLAGSVDVRTRRETSLTELKICSAIVGNISWHRKSCVDNVCKSQHADRKPWRVKSTVLSHDRNSCLHFVAKIQVIVSLPTTTRTGTPNPPQAGLGRFVIFGSRYYEAPQIVPSFNSCLISRDYAVEMRLNFNVSPATNFFPPKSRKPSIMLSLPVQVS